MENKINQYLKTKKKLNDLTKFNNNNRINNLIKLIKEKKLKNLVRNKREMQVMIKNFRNKPQLNWTIQLGKLHKMILIERVEKRMPMMSIKEEVLGRDNNQEKKLIQQTQRKLLK